MSFLPSGVALLALPVPPSQYAAAGYRSQELLTIDILDEVDVSEFMGYRIDEAAPRTATDARKYR